MIEQKDHNCLANALPVVNEADDDTDEPLVSASIADNGEVIVAMRCRKCWDYLDVTYRFEDYEER